MLVRELGAAADARDNYQFTPLHSAANGGHVAAIARLAALGHDLDACDYLGAPAALPCAALRCAALRCAVRCCAVLLFCDIAVMRAAAAAAAACGAAAATTAATAAAAAPLPPCQASDASRTPTRRPALGPRPHAAALRRHARPAGGA